MEKLNWTMDNKFTSALKLPNFVESLSTIMEHRHSGTRTYKICNMKENKLQV
jgi:hypothetical protein